jgi:hypothetical protein
MTDDAVVLAVGVNPDTALAARAGLEVDDGIVVDDRFRTSAPDVYAAGDVARFPAPALGMMRVEHGDLGKTGGVRGGRVTVTGSGLDPHTLGTCRLAFGSTQTRPLLITPSLLVGPVPGAADAETIQVVQQDRQSTTLPFAVATLVAENLHPVTNPALDRHGNVYTTISGTKGQQVLVSLYKITRFGEVEPFASGITNPTGLAFGADEALYVSSRHEGMLYRVDAQGSVSAFAEGVGIATGLAFDAQGYLYVGDRRGTVLRLSPAGEVEPFAKLGPSAAA